MEDSQFPFPSNGATDDENRRHINLRRDILTSLLEVDQSIKGLEHHLAGRIQQIEDRLPAPEAAASADESSRRCDFDPAATTAWALKILQDNLAPISSGVAAIQSALRTLQGKDSAENFLATLQGEITPLRELLRALREDTERLRGSVTDLNAASPDFERQSAPVLEATHSMARSLSSLGEGLEDLKGRVLRSQEAMAPLGEDLARLRESVGDLRDGLAPLGETVEGAARKLAAESREALSPLQDEVRKLAVFARTIQEGLAGVREAIAPLHETASRAAESAQSASSETASLRDEMRSLRAALEETRRSLPAFQQELQRVRESTQNIETRLSGLKESLEPLQESAGRAAESAQSASSGTASLRGEVESLRASLDQSRNSLPSLQEDVRRVQQTAQNVQDRLTGLKDAVSPLRDLVTQAADSAQLGAGGIAALREETRALPGSLRTAREEMEASVRKQGEDQSQLLREIGGKVMEELSLLLVEMRRGSSQGPEALAGFSKEIAEIRSAQKETGKTLSRLRDLMEQNPSAELTLSAIQHVQEQNDASAAGLNRLEESIRNGQAALGQMKESHAKVMQAFESYHQAARQEEERIRLKTSQEHNNRGVVLYYRGALEPAVASFRKALDVQPVYAEAWNNLGLVLSRLGKSDDAAAAFQKAIEIDPGMGEVYNNLGFLYHTSLQYDRALEMFNQALQTSSDSAVAYTNLGNTYYKMSRHEQALQAWKRAVELDPLNENARRCLRMYHQEKS